MTNLPLVSQEEAGLPTRMRVSCTRGPNESSCPRRARASPELLAAGSAPDTRSCNACVHVAVVGLKHPLEGRSANSSASQNRQEAKGGDDFCLCYMSDRTDGPFSLSMP